MSKQLKVEVPLYLLHETDPKPIYSAILTKLQELEEIEYEISGIDNILLQQTDTIRAAKPASADAYGPKVKALQQELKLLKQQEKEAMDQYRLVNVQIYRIRAQDQQVQAAAHYAIEHYLLSMANRNSTRGIVNNGKCAVSAELRKKYDVHQLYLTYRENSRKLQQTIELLTKESKDLESRQQGIEQSYFKSDDKQVKQLQKTYKLAALLDFDITQVKADIVRYENFLSLYQSKIKELEFKRMVEANRYTRRHADSYRSEQAENQNIYEIMSK